VQKNQEKVELMKKSRRFACAKNQEKVESRKESPRCACVKNSGGGSGDEKVMTLHVGKKS
jgi:hypothetical protein